MPRTLPSSALRCSAATTPTLPRRCALVLLAALAMALPHVSSDSPLALLTVGRRELVLVVDRSGSTARRLPGGQTVEARTIELVRRQVQRLSDEQGDAVTLVTPGAGDLLPSPIGASPSQVLSVLDVGLPDPGGTADLVEAVRLVRDRVRPQRSGRLDMFVYTDRQELSWREDLGPLFQEIIDNGGGTLRVIDVAADAGPTTNLGVASLTAQDRVVLAGRPTTYAAVVMNHGDTILPTVSGSFLLDGVLQRKVTLDAIPPRGSAVAELRLRIDTPGPHHVTFALDGDELAFDDQRTLALDLRSTVNVLLVDGAFVPDRMQRATGWLELALEPAVVGGGDDISATGFTTRVVDVASFEDAGRELYRYDVIIMADVGGVSRDAAAVLDKVVRSGTSLLMFTGESVVPRLWDERFGPRGLDMLPATVLAPEGDAGGAAGDDYVSLVLPDPPPAELELFADPRLAVLLQVPVLRWNPLVPTDDAAVLASFVDALGKTWPALVDRPHGLGRVLLMGTSADDSWSLLPRHPATWLPLVHELVTSLAADDLDQLNVPLGQSPVLVVDGRPARARLESPTGAVEEIPSPEVEALGQRARLALPMVLDHAGPWTLDVEPSDPTQRERRVALSALPEAREGDLRRIDDATLNKRLAGVEFVLGEPVDDVGEAARSAGGDGDLFRFLLWALLAAALGESLLARSLGRAR